MRVLFVLALLIGFASPLRAADDVAAARAVITAQVEAITRDDGAVAWSYASPAIQGMFSEADAFMAMVRRSYSPIWRHRSFEFGEGSAEDGRVAQSVHIDDADGVPWEALYTLERQPDGVMKITGCVLLKAPGQAI